MGRPPKTSDRTLGPRLVYGFGVALLVGVPTWLVAAIAPVRRRVGRPGRVGGDRGGPLVGLLLGERGLNAVGRFLRSLLEWRP